MRRLLSWCACLTLLATGGCAVCAHPYDCDYAAYGGLRQRTNMAQGRVASVFDPASEISYERPAEQSPPASPGSVGEAADMPPTLDPTPDVAPESPPRIPSSGTGSPLPEVPDGTIELPDPGFEGDVTPLRDSGPNPSTLPPDLSGNDDRSAHRHPLRDIFADGS